MYKLMGKKIITIIRLKILLIGSFAVITCIFHEMIHSEKFIMGNKIRTLGIRIGKSGIA